jgi:uncharacterized protein with PIN domain
MIDELARRTFLTEVDNHRHETRRALESVIQNANAALASFDGDVNTAALRNVAQYSAEAVAHGNALHVLNRMAFLITEETR